MEARPLKRADELLLAQGLAESRSQAKRFILDGKIRLRGGARIKKPALMLPIDSHLELMGGQPYVSRAGEKLAAFLQKYPLELSQKNALDLGASTGGFTECLLRRDVAHVSCVDVGHSQLHPRIAKDPRVVNLEGANARELHRMKLPQEDYDIIVMDLSFISLTLVLPVAWPLLRPGGLLIALVKPQFEAGKEALKKGRGVIRDPAIHQQVLKNIKDFASVLPHCALIGECPSPIKGGDGNREFLLGWQHLG